MLKKYIIFLFLIKQIFTSGQENFPIDKNKGNFTISITEEDLTNVKNNICAKSKLINSQSFDNLLYNYSIGRLVSDTKNNLDLLNSNFELMYDESYLKNSQEGKHFYCNDFEAVEMFGKFLYNLYTEVPRELKRCGISNQDILIIQREFSDLLLEKFMNLDLKIREGVIKEHYSIGGIFDRFFQNFFFRNMQGPHVGGIQKDFYSPHSTNFMNRIFPFLSYNEQNFASVKELNQFINLTKDRLFKNILKKIALFTSVASGILMLNLIATNTISMSIEKYLSPYFNRYIKYKDFLSKVCPVIIDKKENSLDNLYGYNIVKKKFLELSKDLQKQKNKKTRIEGILLYGPPGNGKTYFVKSLAAESELPLYVVSLSVLLNDKGQIDENLKILFQEVRRNAPCILFFDEFDLIVSNRLDGKLTDQEKQILNQMLQLLDGEDPNLGVLIIANTNYVENIDVALLRYQRLGIHIKIDDPNDEDMYEICKEYCREFKIVIDNFADVYVFMKNKINSFNKKNIVSIKKYIEKIKKHCIKKNIKIINVFNIESINENIVIY